MLDFNASTIWGSGNTVYAPFVISLMWLSNNWGEMFVCGLSGSPMRWYASITALLLSPSNAMAGDKKPVYINNAMIRMRGMR